MKIASDQELLLLVDYLMGNGTWANVTSERRAQFSKYYEKVWMDIHAAGSNSDRFSSWLSRFALRGPRRLLLADAFSALLNRKGPLRQKLNAIVALAECEGSLYRSLSRVPEAIIQTWTEMLLIFMAYALSLLASFVVIPPMYAAHLLFSKTCPKQ